MNWRVDVTPRTGRKDVLGDTARAALIEHGLDGIGRVFAARVYLIQGPRDTPEFRSVASRLLADPVTEEARIRKAATPAQPPDGSQVLLIFKKPGVMDPVEASAIKAFGDTGFAVDVVRTGVRYVVQGQVKSDALRKAAARLLANEVVDEIHVGEKSFKEISLGAPYAFERIECDVEEGLKLSLNKEEVEAIREHYGKLGRRPTDIELETIAQTWSEHCKHKTLMGGVGEHENLLRETIVKATNDIDAPWCVSVFKDNAGIIEFNETQNVCFKVETHNHPSAIEPYGGANTGLGGVIRDILGCGLGAKPVANTDVFCVGPPDLPDADVPAGSIHPRRILNGVVSGVRDYGNRMGIPTVNGAVFFDERYTGNPLVYCGTVGLIPKGKENKKANPGDLIVAVGGRTGRDGIHGATFSSAALTEESETISGGAVQIGNAIVEKRVMDTVIQARDRDLYSCITDCGAGGFSSAVGEMGEETGAEVDLDNAPLKYEGLTYAEIWISEAQERMVLATPPDKVDELLALFAAEDVEAVVIGRFTGDGMLRLHYKGESVGELSMEFLHNGNPRLRREAFYTPRKEPDPEVPTQDSHNDDLLAILGSWNVCSKEWIVRQYDHEVQAGSVIKPLVGVESDGPGDAAVVRPVLDSEKAVAIGCGMNPLYGDLDTYAMAASAIDEAVRNVVCVGGDPSRTAILDNFSWGSATDPESLGALAAACQACHDVAIALRTPFISGKDSLNNTYQVGGETRSIPHSLLISAISIVQDIHRCVTMDLKQPGNLIYLVGETKAELGGSHFYKVKGLSGGTPPVPDLDVAPRLFRQLAFAIRSGMVRSCHDLSEGGLAVAAAEMAFAGGFGLTLEGGDHVHLFSESNTRFLVEVEPDEAANFEGALKDLPCRNIGEVAAETRLKIGTVINLGLEEMKAAWKKPLAW